MVFLNEAEIQLKEQKEHYKHSHLYSQGLQCCKKENLLMPAAC